MFYGVTAPDGSLHYCNGGQEPPAVVRRDRIDVEIGRETDGDEPARASKLTLPFSPTMQT